MLRNNDKNESIAATIMSFITALLSYSNFKIDKVWKFILCFAILIIIYIVWYFIIKYVQILISKILIKSNDIEFEPSEEIERLKNNAFEIYLKFLEYKKTTIEKYKKVLFYELKKKILMTENQISIISEAIKNNEKFFTNNFEFNMTDLQLYIDFINIVKISIF